MSKLIWKWLLDVLSSWKPHPEFLFPKDVLCLSSCFSGYFRCWLFWQLGCVFHSTPTSHYEVGSGEKSYQLFSKSLRAQSFLMDLLFVGKLTTGRPRRKIRESSKLHVEIDYSGRKSCWRVLCAKRKNITRHTSPQKEIDYVKKERSSNRKYVWKRK